MKNSRWLSLVSALAMVFAVVAWSGSAQAQSASPSTSNQQQQQTQSPDTPANTPPQNTPQSDSPAQSTQQPDSTTTPDSQPKGNSPAGSTAGAATDPGSQTFVGTVHKQGTRYVLQDDAGKTYDVDQQDELKKFDGKRVRVQGTLDSSGQKITVK
jgi:hypothetical protein